jgi:hypothetical protein
MKKAEDLETGRLSPCWIVPVPTPIPTPPPPAPAPNLSHGGILVSANFPYDPSERDCLDYMARGHVWGGVLIVN